MRSRSLNFTIAIVLRSIGEMVITDRDLDREKKIAIDDQKIVDQSCLAVGAPELNSVKFVLTAAQQV